ncbi:hypothetical protein K144313037_p20610 (plasmid) [Clostridium tetani]|uniref:hypothetical protein n=1 Tax=Clostridium tetani TaxID=1513 RepID=UPI000D204E36|nr:hypothetical protein [Clostridium tetani]AVP54512.1 hypothetical protein C3B72_04980 [Clostridium tetani]RXI75221.1 hypothetical protein DP128_11725 [Clostridium tetani]RXM53899.1 hypothetical protein DP134_14245 [Clostridium tetani]WFN62908.1 hypothetical protein PAA20_05525 [Clostridium tetani]SUY55115.1 Uncharacterised protein [Clostridium tetani]
MFKGCERLEEIYCTRGSCRRIDCKYNQEHALKQSTQSGIEFTVKAFYGTDKCLFRRRYKKVGEKIF